ncbi:MAG: hypothetical protein KAR01_13940, partial [Desulfocapsa sp.]|nr:hypothetical protein [Desulfocapsa sp.]
PFQDNTSEMIGNFDPNLLASQDDGSSNDSIQPKMENRTEELLNMLRTAMKGVLDFAVSPAAASPLYQTLPEIKELIFDQDTLLTQLDAMNMDLDLSFEEHKSNQNIKLYLTNGISISVMVGAASYLLRSGSLLSSFLATVPLWKGFDPVAILAIPKGELLAHLKSASEIVSSSITGTEQTAEEMFTKEENQR